MVHESADGLIDYVKLIFHTDMGDGHLENFESGQGLDFDLAPTVVDAPLLAIVTNHSYMVSGALRFIVSEFYLKDDPFPDPPSCSSFSLRGPPVFS